MTAIIELVVKRDTIDTVISQVINDGVDPEALLIIIRDSVKSSDIPIPSLFNGTFREFLIGIVNITEAAGKDTCTIIVNEKLYHSL